MEQNPKGINKLQHKSVKLPIQLKLHGEMGYHSDRGTATEENNLIFILGNTRRICFDGLCLDAELTIDNKEMVSKTDIWMNKIVDLEVIVDGNDHLQAHGKAKWYYIPENNPDNLELGIFITQMPDQERDRWNRLLHK